MVQLCLFQIIVFFFYFFLDGFDFRFECWSRNDLHFFFKFNDFAEADSLIFFFFLFELIEFCFECFYFFSWFLLHLFYSPFQNRDFFCFDFLELFVFELQMTDLLLEMLYHVELGGLTENIWRGILTGNVADGLLEDAWWHFVWYADLCGVGLKVGLCFTLWDWLVSLEGFDEGEKTRLECRYSQVKNADGCIEIAEYQWLW